jgi:hypothetical protein
MFFNFFKMFFLQTRFTNFIENNSFSNYRMFIFTNKNYYLIICLFYFTNKVYYFFKSTKLKIVKSTPS